jgi:alpha-mannosidase
MRLAPTLLTLSACLVLSAGESPPDFTKDRVLYVVPYAHLDTQWRWTYITSIDQFIRNTIEENLANFAKFPKNVFTFTGSSRFQMMQEYYPDGFAKVKALIKAGRWHVGGSSVEENDANVPSPESGIRQVLYGNRYFRREFAVESIDYMLPDCFGFQAHLPSVWAHCGLKGFSTQKLSWGSARGVPFEVGVWEGVDGTSIVAALNGTDYTGSVGARLDTDPHWIERMERSGKRSNGVFVDYRYFGVGDRGGAPRQGDIQKTLDSMGNPDGRFQVRMTGSDQMFRDLPADAVAKLPRITGDMLLTAHSSGSISSQAYMKRWNRKSEQLADSAERAAVAARWLGGPTYPFPRLEEAWYRVLVSQMHDIMPGTSLPKAYELSWNDEVVALNLFAGVLDQSVAHLARGLDTKVAGVPLVLWNPLAIQRRDVVEATVDFGSAPPAAVSATGPDGKPVPVQILGTDGNRLRLALLPDLAPLSASVVAIVPTAGAPAAGGLRVAKNGLENERWKVALNTAGDVASIIDKAAGDRELLRSPHQLQFQYHKPREFPAWNMDWDDQRKAPMAVVDGEVKVRIIERGPVRVALEVTRQARDSIFVQTIRLSAGGERIEFANRIDWQSKECALKASFPLTVSNPKATYNLGLGTIERATNDEREYEKPHREWFDLTAGDGSYGVSILEDSKFASDKPDDATLRLTLLYTPGVRGDYLDQYSQDWGRHDITYAVYGHRGDWRNGSQWQARRLNQPVVAFQVGAHAGPLGRSLSLASVSTPQVDLRTLKAAEDGDAVIVRLQELDGRPADQVAVRFAGAISEAWEVDGQERRIGDARIVNGALVTSLGAYRPRSFAVKLKAGSAIKQPTATAVPLAFDTDVVTPDSDRADGAMDGEGRSYPAEQFPAAIDADGLSLRLGPVADGAKQALSCAGQRLVLPPGDTLVLVAAATQRVDAVFTLDGRSQRIVIPAWTGFVGQFDNRLWDRPFGDIDYICRGTVTGIASGYINREPIGWPMHHRHSVKLGNESYRFTYLFVRKLPLAGARSLTLPNDPRVRLFAAAVVTGSDNAFAPAAPLYEDFSDRGPIDLRVKPPEYALLAGLKPAGIASIDRKAEWADLTMGLPRPGNAASGRPVRTVGTRKATTRDGRGADQGLVLTDGRQTENEDDLSRCLWFDGGESRFILDLGASIPIARVATYSNHKSNRAPQQFTLWGSNATEPPSGEFTTGKDSGWTYLARVDSYQLGEGGKHGSVVSDREGGALGPFRWLLWIGTGTAHEGTFFSEIAVDAAKQ